jgi:hypothetical protein
MLLEVMVAVVLCQRMRISRSALSLQGNREAASCAKLALSATFFDAVGPQQVAGPLSRPEAYDYGAGRGLATAAAPRV